MIIPIKCTTCGTMIADKYAYYCAEVTKQKIAKNMDETAVIYLTKDNYEKSPIGEVLDSLHLKQCCRLILMTHVDII